MSDTRDLRDPQTLGEVYLEVRSKGVDRDIAIQMPAPDYDNGEFISSDPAEHHSKTDQTIQHQEPADGVPE